MEVTGFFKSEKEKQRAIQPVLGQEVMERCGLVVQGSAPRLGAVGCKALCALGGHWAVAGQWNQLQEMGALQAPASLLFFPSNTEVLGMSEQGLCALHLLPLPPFLLGNRELFQPAAYLPFLVPAEEEPAEPKLRMLGLRLCWCRWCLRCGAGRAVPACRGEVPTLLTVTQLWSPRERTRGSHGSLLL